MPSPSAPVLEPAETVSDLSARRGHSPPSGSSTCCTAAPR